MGLAQAPPLVLALVITRIDCRLALTLIAACICLPVYFALLSGKLTR